MTASLPSCPLPLADYPRVVLAHGSGGRLMRQLIESVFVRAFGPAAAAHDGACVAWEDHRVTLTTDSFVVDPLEFPGGDIGALAVYGTANDLAMCGARPVALAAAFILEEGLPMETLWRACLSMRRACDELGISIATGDTKVVQRGKADGLFITTTGIGRMIATPAPLPTRVRSGARVLVSGDLGRHGMAVMSVREGLALQTPIVSDCGSLAAPALALIEGGIEVQCMRDLTRGGLASALNEIASDASVAIELEEPAIPIASDVRGVCEILGLDPAYVACEGRFVAIVPDHQATAALKILKAHPISAGACEIGRIGGQDPAGRVTGRSAYGSVRTIDMLAGAALPRIC